MYSDEGDQYEGGFGNQTEEELLDITRIIHHVKTLKWLFIAFRHRSKSNSHYSLRHLKGEENRKQVLFLARHSAPLSYLFLLPTFPTPVTFSIQSLHSSLSTTVQYNNSTTRYQPIFALSSSCPLFQPHCFSLSTYSFLCFSCTSPISLLCTYQVFLASGTLYSGI